MFFCSHEFKNKFGPNKTPLSISNWKWRIYYRYYSLDLISKNPLNAIFRCNKHFLTLTRNSPWCNVTLQRFYQKKRHAKTPLNCKYRENNHNFASHELQEFETSVFLIPSESTNPTYFGIKQIMLICLKGEVTLETLTDQKWQEHHTQLM